MDAWTRGLRQDAPRHSCFLAAISDRCFASDVMELGRVGYPLCSRHNHAYLLVRHGVVTWDALCTRSSTPTHVCSTAPCTHVCSTAPCTHVYSTAPCTHLCSTAPCTHVYSTACAAEASSLTCLTAQGPFPAETSCPPPAPGPSPSTTGQGGWRCDADDDDDDDDDDEENEGGGGGTTFVCISQNRRGTVLAGGMPKKPLPPMLSSGLGLPPT